MGGFRLPQQSAQQQTTLAIQTMCDVVAISPDLFRSVFVGVFGPSGRDRRYECCVNTLTHLWDGANADTVDEGTLENLAFLQGQHGEIKMEAEERARQPQEITRKFEQLFPILSMRHNSLQHPTTITIPQIIKSRKGRKYLVVFCSRVTFKKLLTVGVLIPSPKPPPPPHPATPHSRNEGKIEIHSSVLQVLAFYFNACFSLD